jgi:pilus assembly protein TadC
MTGWRGWLLSAASGGAVAVLMGGAFGAVVGLVAAIGGVVALRRAEPPGRRRERERALADLPIAADLLAAALRSGAPPDRAAMVVGAALGGPVGTRLERVARALRLGAAPAMAWQHLADLPGGDRLASAATRSAERGTALTRALDHQAVDLRAARAAAAEAAARRVGVLVVLPLGLCFLPAFLLAGVVPVVVAVLGDVLQTP